MAGNPTNQMGMLYMTNLKRHRENSVMNERQYNGGCNNTPGNRKLPPDSLRRCPSAVLGSAAMRIPALQGAAAMASLVTNSNRR